MSANASRPRPDSPQLGLRANWSQFTLLVIVNAFVGVYRLWRDGGCAVGALASGLLADLFSIPAAIAAIGTLTFLSGLVSSG